MSGVTHAIGKVFKAVGSVIKKVWKPLVIAAAIYFTGGLALGAMGAMSAGGGLLAGAGAGLEAAAGGIGIGAGAGIGGAFAAGAGTAAAEGLGAAALGAGAAGAADLGGAGVLTAEGAEAAGLGGAAGGSVLGDSSVLAGTAGVGGGSAAAGAAAVGAPSSMWSNAVNFAGKVMTTPGGPSLISGLLNSYSQSQMLNAQMKWQEAHAPGQIAGGAGGAWQGFGPNQNQTASQTPLPNANLPPLHPTATGPIPLTQVSQPALPGANQPGSASSQYPGYGTPGYGQQSPAPPGYVPQQGLMNTQMPYIDSPFDQSYT